MKGKPVKGAYDLIFDEQDKDLFEVSNDYFLAHCISSDCVLGAGIAVGFEKRFSLREKLLALSEDKRQSPACVKIGRVFNLITKTRYYNKPTYDTVKASLLQMKEQALKKGIKKIAMSRIACGLDNLTWNKVKRIIIEVFTDTDIDITICFINQYLRKYDYYKNKGTQ
jgi:hypothetical protein